MEMRMNTKINAISLVVCAFLASAVMAQNNTFPASGSVGVGTTSPFAKLHVANGSMFVSGDSGALASGAGPGLALKYTNDTAFIFGYDYTTNLFKTLALQAPGGSVDIGMTGSFPSTNSRLNIMQADDVTGLAIGNATTPRLALNGNSDGSWTAYDYSSGSWASGITQKSGNVGIHNPPFGIGYPLDVYHYIRVASSPSDTTSESAGLILSNRGAGTTNGEYMWQIVTGGPNQSSGIWANGLEMWEYPNPAKSYGCCLARLVIKKASSNTVSPKSLVIDGLGNVGIGVSDPQYALDVNGMIHATQVIGATYQDVAEWVPATMKMSPGTVVVVKRGSKNTVARSDSAYATSVAGVVSAQPGVLLGKAGESKAMIATTGRVKVHVDASAGAIEAGDLLVTSDKPGLAMKSQPIDVGGVKIHRPGTLIGKALESLSDGEGDILVLLSLQ